MRRKSIWQYIFQVYQPSIVQYIAVYEKKKYLAVYFPSITALNCAVYSSI